mgnify:CR=1 FL=1
MEQFTDLLLSIENTSKTLSKVKYLKEYFTTADEKDRVWAIALFTHKRPKRQVNTRLLAEWAFEQSNIEPWLFEESYHVVGDLSETISLILPQCDNKTSHSLTYWINHLIDLQDKEELEKKSFILNAWKQLDQKQKWVFNKLITGGFRIGVSKNLIIRAIAEATDQEPTEIAHRLMGNWNPSSTSYKNLVLEESKGESLSRPYPFYLAYPLEEVPEDLGDTSEWTAEWKWDGIRSQVIVRDKQLFIWSRGEDLITEKFPELSVLEALPDGTVIDGELVGYNESGIMPFSVLQTRIGRKNVSKKYLKEAPAAIIAYDLLEFKGEDMRKAPFKERRKFLRSIVKKADLNKLKLSEEVRFSSWGELAQLRKRSREYDAEGLMLKRNRSEYKVGRKRGDWWKWKVDPYTVDAVMIYAQKGHGRRADIYSDYTFAVWDDDQLVPFAKAYSGLTDKEMLEVTRFVKSNTLERFGPVRTVTPTLVFEIHFEGIAPSSRHKSGVAVRFPRIHRWRKDKKPEEANNLQDIKALLKHP